MANWVLDDYGVDFKDKNTLSVNWTRKDTTTPGAIKQGAFDYAMPNDKYWPAIKAEVLAKINAEEGLFQV